MRKSLLIAVAMVLALCFYGFFASTAGHDHRQHDQTVEPEHSGEHHH